jgi:hypothetical protein
MTKIESDHEWQYIDLENCKNTTIRSLNSMQDGHMLLLLHRLKEKQSAAHYAILTYINEYNILPRQDEEMGANKTNETLPTARHGPQINFIARPHAHTGVYVVADWANV